MRVLGIAPPRPPEPEPGECVCGCAVYLTCRNTVSEIYLDASASRSSSAAYEATLSPEDLLVPVWNASRPNVSRVGGAKRKGKAKGGAGTKKRKAAPSAS